MDSIVKTLANELGKKEQYVENVVNLIDEGNTIPFIARYRKEMHGTMNDTELRTLYDRLVYLRNLQKRKDEVRSSIEAQGKLDDEITGKLEEAKTLTEVEDIYRPFKQKRRTRATEAIEKGLGPLAEAIYAQDGSVLDINKLAEGYIDEEKGVLTVNDAIKGASDIIADVISDSADIRKRLREMMMDHGIIESRAAKEEDSVYRIYYKFEQPVSKMQGHQILAINRGEKTGFLKVSVNIERSYALGLIWNETVLSDSQASKFVQNAAEDAYDRLIYPSIEREMRNILTDSASEGAIKTFALNLKQLLMHPPVKGKTILGLDPAYRTGCKIAVVDATGRVLATSVIYPTPPHNKVEEAERTVTALIKKYDVDHISIGNGTASRESEKFIADVIGKLDKKVSYAVVSEAGASVYSASKLASEEFPEYDVSLRSAVSIARRLQDPLAELVKIDPKSIGVGQYQHDMPQNRLGETLEGVVEDCVNAVGVDLNTASQSLLEHIAGLNSTISRNIVAYREENGAFSSRKQLLKVPKLGKKTYEQCAGFLRVPESKVVLDNTGVHPENYDAAIKLLELCGYTLEDVSAQKIADLKAKVGKIGEEKAAELCQVGVPTLRDIISELIKPGRDIRDDLPAPIMRTDVMEMKDLKPGMTLTGVVRNITDFGAFVDIGVHQDGLVHISQISDKYIKHPSEALSVDDIVNVVVLEVDEAKKRISLSIKQAANKK